MSIKTITSAIAEDAISYVTGLPIGTLRQAISAVTPCWMYAEYFLDWELKKWLQIYFREVKSNKCIEIFYRGKPLLLPQVVVFDNTSIGIKPSEVHLIAQEEVFVLSHELRAATEDTLRLQRRFLKAHRRRYWNENLLRLVDFSLEGDKVTLWVQSVQYEDCLRTNLSLDARPARESTTLRERIHSEGELEELKSSPFANPFGVNFLLFTSDGKLVMQKRSHQVVVRPGELAPSSSGDFTYTDVPPTGQTSLAQMPKFRETFEELGLHPQEIPADQVYFLGITRELIRGGKPEAFYAAMTVLSESQFKDRWLLAEDRFESKKLLFFDFGRLAQMQLEDEQKRHAFLSLFDELIDAYKDKFSIPLWTNLAFWCKHRLTNRPPSY